MHLLSPNFSLEELTRSQEGLRLNIYNVPSDDQVAELERLCETLLEPARALLGVPLHVDSGYRSPGLNRAVGGSPKSAHMSGRAADVIPIGLDIEMAFDTLRKSDLPFDAIIFECRAWLHLQISAYGVAPRGNALLAAGSPGAWVYTQV